MNLKYFVIAWCLFGWLSHSAIAEDDDYLSLISSEAEKIEEEGLATENPPVEENPSLDMIKIQEFESLLKDEYIGSYLIYRRLDQSSRNVLYDDYES
ncbi:MAG: hypothetical protein P8179_17620, partial [Candidatus Thiodiazotropha sp.]